LRTDHALIGRAGPRAEQPTRRLAIELRSAAMRSTGHGVPAAFLAARAAASALLCGTALAQPAPPPDRLCPAIDEGYVLCSGDLASGNCGQFVAAAETLAQLFQIQAAESPDRVPMLLSTNWWGCGSATLIDMKALLGRLDRPRAQALLRSDPFQRLPAAEWRASPPGARPPAGPPVAPDCVSLATPSAQAECAARDLAAVRAAHQSALQACQAAVAPGLRTELADAEAAWQQGLAPQCDAAAFEYQDPELQSFARSTCLANATRERTRSMLAAHPECQGQAR
jgi:uncharacterized protein YecT (DUF1311 family)